MRLNDSFKPLTAGFSMAVLTAAMLVTRIPAGADVYQTQGTETVIVSGTNVWVITDFQDQYGDWCSVTMYNGQVDAENTGCS